MSGNFYTLIGEKEEGPFSFEQIERMAKGGVLGPEVLVSAPGWSEWLAVKVLLAKRDRAKWENPPTIQASNVIIAGAVPQSDFLPSGSDAVFVIGMFLVIGGMILGGLTYAMEVSVPGGEGRIVNLGLISDRILMGLGAICAILFGGLLFCCSAVMVLSERFKTVKR